MYPCYLKKVMIGLESAGLLSCWSVCPNDWSAVLLSCWFAAMVYCPAILQSYWCCPAGLLSAGLHWSTVLLSYCHVLLVCWSAGLWSVSVCFPAGLLSWWSAVLLVCSYIILSFGSTLHMQCLTYGIRFMKHQLTIKWYSHQQWTSKRWTSGARSQWPTLPLT